MQHCYEPYSLATLQSLELPEPGRRYYAIQDFFSSDPRELVKRCYVILLGRLPDPEGLSGSLLQICSGMTMIELIDQIRQSPEGMQRPVRIRGLLLARLAERYRNMATVSVLANKLGLLPPQPDLRGYQPVWVDAEEAGTGAT